MAELRDTLNRHAQDLVNGNMAGLMGDFTPEAKSFAEGKPIEVVAGPELLALVQSVQRPSTSRTESPSPSTAAPATGSDPTCPTCDAPMVRRTARQTKTAFLGHVGSAAQGINRVPTAFAWLDKKWPDRDRDTQNNGGEILASQMFTPPTTGRPTPYALFLPPGYARPENASRRYPVVYFLHGYGQEPDDLVQLSGVFASYMVASGLPPEQRFQKSIIVYVDGRCRPNVGGVPVPAGGDHCEGGTLYLEAPAGGLARMETNLLELMDHIDRTYRTKPAAMIDVVK